MKNYSNRVGFGSDLCPLEFSFSLRNFVFVSCRFRSCYRVVSRIVISIFFHPHHLLPPPQSLLPSHHHLPPPLSLPPLAPTILCLPFFTHSPSSLSLLLIQFPSLPATFTTIFSLFILLFQFQWFPTTIYLSPPHSIPMTSHHLHYHIFTLYTSPSIPMASHHHTSLLLLQFPWIPTTLTTIFSIFILLQYPWLHNPPSSLIPLQSLSNNNLTLPTFSQAILIPTKLIRGGGREGAAEEEIQ